MATKSRFNHENKKKYKKVGAFLLFYCKTLIKYPEIIVCSYREKYQKRAKREFALFILKKKRANTLFTLLSKTFYWFNMCFESFHN